MTFDSLSPRLPSDRERLLTLLDHDALGKLTLDGAIARIGEDPAVDLHIDDDIVDIHDALRTRSIRGAPISSEVAWAMVRHSLLFPSLHGSRLASLPHNAIVGDLGCGQIPYWSSLPRDRIAGFYGFDGHLPSLRIAEREFASDHRLLLVHATAERTPVPDGVFDAVISSEVIEHVEDPAAYLREAWRILKPGGILSLSTPCASMYVWPSELLKVAVGWTSPRVFWKRLTPERRWREALSWHPAVRPRILANWVRAVGFEVHRHDSTLWNVQSVTSPSRRVFEIAEKFVGFRAAQAFSVYLNWADALTQTSLPFVRFLGLRQFLTARKPES